MKKLDAFTAILNRADLKPGEKLVLLGILRHTRGDTLAGAFPSATTLACYASVRVATIWPHLKSLEKRKLISRTSGGKGEPNSYSINAAALVDTDKLCEAPSCEQQAENPPTLQAEKPTAENPPTGGKPAIPQAEKPRRVQAENPPTKRYTKSVSKRGSESSHADELFGDEAELPAGVHQTAKGFLAVGVTRLGKNAGKPFNTSISKTLIAKCAKQHGLTAEEANETARIVLEAWASDGFAGYGADGTTPAENFPKRFAANLRAFAESTKAPPSKQLPQSSEFVDAEGWDSRWGAKPT